MMNGAKLRLAHVGKRFQSGSAAATVAVDDFTLDVAQGEFLVIVGPSGCGKTTVLNMLAGLERADAAARVAHRRPRDHRARARDRGVMFQDYALFPWHTVRGNVELRPAARTRRATGLDATRARRARARTASSSSA